MKNEYENGLFDIDYYDDDDCDSDKHYYDDLMDSDKKFERTKEYFLKNKVKTDGDIDSVTWLEQVDAISILAGYNKDTLQYFFHRFDYDTLVANNIIPLFYEEDGRCQFDVFYSLDKNIVKIMEWQGKSFELRFEKDRVCRDDKHIRKMILQTMDDIEDYTMKVIDPGSFL